MHASPTLDRSLIARLHREWHALATRPAVVARARHWQLGVPFSTLDDVVAATGFWATRSARLSANEATAGDEVLARLLVAARTDDVAARVVLQRLLPGLIARSRRWGGSRWGGATEAFDELVSAAWTVIREFPVERRPGNLAAKLLRDVDHRAFGKATRRMLVHELTEPRLLDVAVELAPTLEPCDELAEVVAATNSLTARDRRLIELLAAGCSAAQVAVALDVSERSVRNYRDAVVHRLRAAALAA